MDFIRSTSEKMKLWQVEHFFPPFFSRSVLIGWKFIFTKKSITRFAFQCNFNQSALIWKKTGEKSVQLVRVSFFRKYFLWNPYFSKNCWNKWSMFKLFQWNHVYVYWRSDNGHWPRRSGGPKKIGSLDIKYKMAPIIQVRVT